MALWKAPHLKKGLSMKTLLLILFICFNVIAVPDCYKNYASAIEKIDNIYKKAQYRHSLVFKDHYHYEIFPTILFPFFCVPDDTIKKLRPCGAIYLCDATIGLNLDRSDIKHLQIAVLQYTIMGNSAPGIKYYTMYFLKWDIDKKDWVEDRGPLTVTLMLKNDGSYRVK